VIELGIHKFFRYHFLPYSSLSFMCFITFLVRFIAIETNLEKLKTSLNKSLWKTPSYDDNARSDDKLNDLIGAACLGVSFGKWCLTSSFWVDFTLFRYVSPNSKELEPKALWTSKEWSFRKKRGSRSPCKGKKQTIEAWWFCTTNAQPCIITKCWKCAWVVIDTASAWELQNWSRLFPQN